MSTHNLVEPPADEIDGGSMYADFMVIDEGGIDLKVDGETIIGASFDGLCPFQLAYEVLPESFVFDSSQAAEDFEKLVELSSKNIEGIPDTDLELAARAFLTALARRKGYEK